MITPEPNSPDALSEAILAEGGRERDEIIRRAQQESGLTLATAVAEADKIRREQLDSARAEAARRGELILATIPVETGRLRSARIEGILESVHEEARRELQACKLDGHKIVVTLAIEAIHRMPGTDFILKISTADHAVFGDKLAEEICQRAGRSLLNITIAADSTVTDAGVVVESADGFQIWDNRLLPRLERLWPELRRQIAAQTPLVGKSERAGGAV